MCLLIKKEIRVCRTLDLQQYTDPFIRYVPTINVTLISVYRFVYLIIINVCVRKYLYYNSTQYYIFNHFNLPFFFLIFKRFVSLERLVLPQFSSVKRSTFNVSFRIKLSHWTTHTLFSLLNSYLLTLSRSRTFWNIRRVYSNLI